MSTHQRVIAVGCTRIGVVATVDHIVSGAGDECIAALATHECVIAIGRTRIGLIAAVDDVVPGAADEHVAALATHQRIVGIGSVGVGVVPAVDDVVSGTGDECVTTLSAHKCVIAVRCIGITLVTSVDDVVPRAANERIASLTAHERVAAVGCVGIALIATVDDVVSRTGDQRVIALSAHECVIAVGCIGVALIATVDDVVSRAGDECVVALAADECVVAVRCIRVALITAVDDIVSGTRNERVVAIASDERIIAVGCIGVALIATVDDVVSRAGDQSIAAVAADERIVAVGSGTRGIAAVERIVTATASEQVGVFVPLEHVGERAAGKVFKAALDFDRMLLDRGCRRVDDLRCVLGEQVERDAERGEAVVDRVDAAGGSVVFHEDVGASRNLEVGVVSRAADHCVIAESAVEEVVAGTSDQPIAAMVIGAACVVARFVADEPVVAGAAGQHIVAVAADQFDRHTGDAACVDRIVSGQGIDDDLVDAGGWVGDGEGIIVGSRDADLSAVRRRPAVIVGDGELHRVGPGVGFDDQLPLIGRADDRGTGDRPRVGERVERSGVADDGLEAIPSGRSAGECFDGERRLDVADGDVSGG